MEVNDEAGHFLNLAVAIADGRLIDWSAEESSIATPEDKAFVEQLHVLAALALVHSTPPLPAAAMPQPRGVAAGLLLSPTPGDRGTTHPSADSFVSPSEDQPTSWAHLNILERVGQGSFGAVFRALDRHLDREVALKLLHRPTFHDMNTAVVQEGRVLARIRHPNVVTVYGANYVDGSVGLWMEFVHGHTLKQIVEERGVLSAREAALVGLDLARALAAVHAAGLVHRDIKAQNVMREEGGRIVLMDFGTGVETDRATALAGTPLYLAPELFEGAAPTAQSDLYSLGVLLFFLTTGSYPVTGKTASDVQEAHASAKRQRLRDLRPDIPAPFVHAVERLLAADRADRFQTAGALDHALDRIVGGTVSSHPRLRPWLLAGAAMLLLAAGATVTLDVFHIRDRLNIWSPSPVIRSIAVLPMVNLSGDPAQEYFVDGLTDLLIEQLSRISSLRVTSRTSAMVYKGGHKALGAIGRELNVDAVLEASMIHAGSALRVTATLRRPSDDSRLWGQTYEATMADAFKIQAQIVRELVTGIRLRLKPAEDRDLGKIYVARQDAQDLYLRGRFLLYQFNREQMREACETFAEAVAIEPRYGLAWASLARCYILRENYGDLSEDEARRLVTEAASRAIAEDPSLAEAHIATAEAQFKFDWNWVGAHASYVRGLEANPNYSYGRSQYARFLWAAERNDEALEQARRAEEIDPLSAEVKGTVAMSFYALRQYASAVDYSDRAIALNPRIGHAARGRALSEMGRYGEAIDDIKQIFGTSNNPSALAELGRIYAASGMFQEAETILNQLLAGRDASGSFTTPPDGVAYLLAALGRRDEALTWLERAVDQRVSRILWLRGDQRVDSLTAEPRFRALLNRIGGLP